MTDWTTFPTRRIAAETRMFRIHRADKHPAWFNTSGDWRFDPPATHRDAFGTCYVSLDPLASYVEVFGRFRAIPYAEVQHRSLSDLTANRGLDLGDVTVRTVIGDFGMSADVSVGVDYAKSQELAANLFEAGFDGVFYRIRHDPSLEFEGLAIFGEPGVTPARFDQIKTSAIPGALVENGRSSFHINVLHEAPLPGAGSGTR